MALRFLLLALLVACTRASVFDTLKQWIIDSGGQVNAEVDYNGRGVRGLFATSHVAAGDVIVSVPASCVLSVGAAAAGSILQNLRSPSRFSPYLDMLPGRQEVVNGCNLPAKYWPMLQSEHWGGLLAQWQGYLHDSITHGGVAEAADAFEAGSGFNSSLSQEDIEYACALAFTRALHDEDTGDSFFIPAIDLANHRRSCPHRLHHNPQDGSKQLLAGADIQAGEEVCLSYHPSLRDDYAFVHYGFVPEEEFPPRLFMADHHHFNDQYFEYEHFVGSLEETSAELARLQSLRDTLDAEFPSLQMKVAGPSHLDNDPTSHKLSQLHERRIKAIDFECARLERSIRVLNGEEVVEEEEEQPEGGGGGSCSGEGRCDSPYGQSSSSDWDTEQQRQQQEQEQQQAWEQEQEQKRKQEEEKREEKQRQREWEERRRVEADHDLWQPEWRDKELGAKFELLKKWVRDYGGMVKATLDDSSGERLLVASTNIPQGEAIAMITFDVTIAIWRYEDVVHLQKLIEPTFYQPYVDMMPRRDEGELVNICNLQAKYLPLLQSKHWAGTVDRWQRDLDAQLVNSSRYPNAVRHVEVELREYMTSDLRRACTSVFSRRVFNDHFRNLMVMLPIIDLARHKRKCNHTVVRTDDSSQWTLVAGTGLRAGDEVCFSYKDTMRDDYAFIHYGFVPAEEHPPRLFLADHHLFGSETPVEDQVFQGSLEETHHELERLQHLMSKLRKSAGKQAGIVKSLGATDPVVEKLVELQRRRKLALQYEIERLTAETILLEQLEHYRH